MDEEKRTGSWDKNGIKVIVVWSRLVHTTFKTELFSGTGCRSGGGLTVEEPLGSIKPGRFEATQAPSLGRKKKKSSTEDSET